MLSITRSPDELVTEREGFKLLPPAKLDERSGLVWLTPTQLVAIPTILSLKFLLTVMTPFVPIFDPTKYHKEETAASPECASKLALVKA